MLQRPRPWFVGFRHHLLRRRPTLPLSPAPTKMVAVVAMAVGKSVFLPPPSTEWSQFFDSLVAAPGLPTTAPSATTTAAATAAAVSNDDVNESLELDVVPNHYVCPITKMIMTDPVSDAFGHSYEKTAIELWLSEHSTSPVTGAQLPNKTLTSIMHFGTLFRTSTVAPLLPPLPPLPTPPLSPPTPPHSLRRWAACRPSSATLRAG
jgi:hypothetical protein